MTKDRPTLAAHGTELARSLSEFDITMIGVGAMIGAGIFVLTGIAAGATGPSLMLAFALNGVVTIFTAMVYAELGSAIPEAGGGYLWVKDALGKDQGFLAGWMSWFSHAVAGALYALGFGGYAVHLLERYGVHVPGAGFLSPEKLVGVAIAVAFVAINLRGASETGAAGNVVTIAKVVTIVAFIGFGLWEIAQEPSAAVDRYEPFFPEGYGAVFLAMGITFIAYEGYEIIVQAGEEVRDPRRSIPRAVFKSLMIVIPIYVLVAVVSIGAVDAPGGQSSWQFLGERKELGLAVVARQFMPYGTLIILIGGLLSTISALNATTYSSTRVSFAMGRDRVLPDAFARVHHRFKTPHVALGATACIILFMVVAIPIEAVAVAADVMFLLLFLQVNYAVIRIRNEFGDRLEYGYLMPFFPWVPVIGIAAQAVLAVYLYRYSPTAWYYALGWILVGLAIYWLYSRDRLEEEDRPRVTFESKAGIRPGRSVLVGVAKPENAGTVVRIGAAIATERATEVVALNVIRVPAGVRMAEGRARTSEAEPVIDAVAEVAADVGAPVSAVVGIGRSISAVIDDIADREESETIVLGWRGTIHEGRVRGSVAQEVLNRAQRDVLIVKDRGLPQRIDRVLVAVSPGIRHRETVRLGAELARGFDASLHLVTATVADGDREQELRSWLDRLCEDLVEEQVVTEDELSSAVRVTDSAVEAITDEARSAGLVVIGASRDWVLRPTLLGDFADELANRSPRTVVMFRSEEARPVTMLRQARGILRRGGMSSARRRADTVT